MDGFPFELRRRERVADGWRLHFHCKTCERDTAADFPDADPVEGTRRLRCPCGEEVLLAAARGTSNPSLLDLSRLAPPPPDGFHRRAGPSRN